MTMRNLKGLKGLKGYSNIYIIFLRGNIYYPLAELIRKEKAEKSCTYH